MESLVEGRFELRQPFFSTEGLRSGDKDDLVSFFLAPAMICSAVSLRARRNSSQSGDKKKCCEPTGL